MENNCLNCNQIITGNFCANCGQKKYKRIDRKYLTDEIQYTILHTNKGFFYTVKNLVKNPGKTAREFVDGNRVNHYKPVLLVFLLSTISTFISYKILGFGEILERVFSETESPYASQQNEFMIWISNYTPSLMMLSIPVFGLITKISFRKWGHNYYEHFVMNAFYLSWYSILTIILVYPIMYLLKDNYSLLMTFPLIMTFLGTPFLLIWFFRGFYQEKDRLYTTLRALLSYGIFLVIYFGIIILFSIILIIYTINSGGNLQ